MSKQKTRYIVGVDASGNHPMLKEGDGTTGIAVFDTVEDKFITVDAVKSKDYDSWQEYYRVVYNIILAYLAEYTPSLVSIEDYLVYPNKAVHHTYSRCPTCMLNGYILTKLHENGYDYYIRPAVQVKNRWSDEVMFKLGYIEGESKSFEHCHGKSGFHLPDSKELLLSHHLDAMRHALHCAKLELPKNRGMLNA